MHISNRCSLHTWARADARGTLVVCSKFVVSVPCHLLLCLGVLSTQWHVTPIIKEIRELYIWEYMALTARQGIWLADCPGADELESSFRYPTIIGLLNINTSYPWGFLWSKIVASLLNLCKTWPKLRCTLLPSKQVQDIVSFRLVHLKCSS
jgi:hypothetical protein